jgi:hypothetical protein
MQAERVVFHPRRFRFGDDGDVRVESKERVSVRIEPVGACDHEGVVFVEVVLSFVVDLTVDGEDVGMEFVTLAFENIVALTGGEVACPSPFDSSVVAVE